MSLVDPAAAGQAEPMEGLPIEIGPHLPTLGLG